MDELWATIASGVSPVPYRLRDSLPHRWVRFHSLPDAQRYAANEAEHTVVLRSHNAVLNFIAQTGEMVRFVSSGFSYTVEPIRENGLLRQLDPNAVHWRTIPNEDGFSHFYFSEWNWEPGIFDAILSRVAAWEIVDTMLIGTHGHWIYHPYDGGADVIAPDTAKRDSIRDAYDDWLSPHPTGL